ncbi:hypothetical protein [Leifsonia virtsii]|uniref:HTH cro/C1-type domain-containing protein n=1 Tax=Leifsonia virtsii TaxID=3035915 RepID=A0ABT8IUX3_9MICO|nr:hypothetical protein [Leifsonia virtsii]MDN4596614.1 hypothetical protein [Leifsonia virtsii]
MPIAPVFNGGALVAELDACRLRSGLGWPALAEELTQQSGELRAALGDHAVCSGALVRTVRRGSMSCQYALMLLQWLDRSPEDFLFGEGREVGDTRLPAVGKDARLRLDLPELHDAVNQERRRRGLTWAALAEQLDCTASRLTNLRTARLADMELTMRLTQWLGRPAADFVYPATW